MDMLARSARVEEDLSMALEPESIARFEQNIIVREWIPIAVDMEFRGCVLQSYCSPMLANSICRFVHNGSLNALSQYNYATFYPRLVKFKDELGEQIRQYFDAKVRDKLLKAGFRDYVIDFAVLETKFDGKSTGIGGANEVRWQLSRCVQFFIVLDSLPIAAVGDRAHFGHRIEPLLLEHRQRALQLQIGAGAADERAVRAAGADRSGG